MGAAVLFLEANHSRYIDVSVSERLRNTTNAHSFRFTRSGEKCLRSAAVAAAGRTIPKKKFRVCCFRSVHTQNILICLYFVRLTALTPAHCSRNCTHTHTHVWRVRRLCTCEWKNIVFRLSYLRWGKQPSVFWNAQNPYRTYFHFNFRSPTSPPNVSAAHRISLLNSSARSTRLTFVVLRCVCATAPRVERIPDSCGFLGWLIRPMPIFRLINTRECVAHFISRIVYERNG